MDYRKEFYEKGNQRLHCYCALNDTGALNFKTQITIWFFTDVNQNYTDSKELRKRETFESENEKRDLAMGIRVLLESTVRKISNQII